MIHPTPTKPGFYWAKLHTPSGMPEGEAWVFDSWEPVEVIENCLDTDDNEYLGVFVGGVPRMQWLPNFTWGPEIQLPKELT